MMAGGRLFVIDLFSIRSTRRGRAFVGLVRSALADRCDPMRVLPVGVNGHHPYRLFTRVITAVSVPPRRPGTGVAWGGVSLGESEQAEFAGSGDRRVAILDAHLAVQGALVGLHGVQ
jgi:hypothetical protein